MSDVKLFRLNAKREQLRARIEKSLILQAKFGLLCELCSGLALAFSRQLCSLRFQWYPLKRYHLWKLEIRRIPVDLPVSLSDARQSSNRSSKHHSNRDQVICETGYYRDHVDRAGQPLLEDNDQKLLLQKSDELRDTFERAHTRIHHDLRKLGISFQAELDEMKRKLFQETHGE